MLRDQAIAELRRYEPELRASGARRLYLFGSVSRNDAGPKSDVDLFIDYDPRSKFSLLDLIGIQQLLEEKLHRKVDVTTRGSLHRMIRRRVVAEAIRVF